ncbi:MAG: helix-turn-helix domain-containing protein, partial [Flavobacteriales bacterium]
MRVEVKSLKLDEKVVFEKVVMDASFKRLPKTFQGKEACFMFLTKGSFQFRTPTDIYPINQGEGMLAKCGNYFIEPSSNNAIQKTKAVTVIGAYFHPEIVKQFFQSDLSIEPFQRNFETEKVNIDPLMNSFVRNIDYMIENPNLSDDNLITNKLKELLILLSKSDNSNSISDFITSLFVPYENEFSEVIKANICSDLSIPELAKLTNTSLATFKRKFAELYQESPGKYILKRKLEKATELLQIESMAI